MSVRHTRSPLPAGTSSTLRQHFNRESDGVLMDRVSWIVLVACTGTASGKRSALHLASNGNFEDWNGRAGVSMAEDSRSTPWHLSTVGGNFTTRCSAVGTPLDAEHDMTLL